VYDPAELKPMQTFVAAPTGGACPAVEEKLAWVLFFRGHTNLIRCVLKRRGVHESDVDDVEQQVWIALVRRLGRFKNDIAAGTISEYFRRSAGREAARHIRRRSKRLDSALTAELESMLLDPGPGPLSEYECKERRDRARAILAAARSSLSGEDHRMLVMRCIDERSIREIAAAFLVSEECAKKRLQRSIEAVKSLPLSR
jgi:RNA polymerase sigma factor (sigma-70 family)